MAQVRAAATTMRMPDPENAEGELAVGVVVLNIKTSDFVEAAVVLPTAEHRDQLLGDLVATLGEEERAELAAALTESKLVVADASQMPTGPRPGERVTPS